MVEVVAHWLVEPARLGNRDDGGADSWVRRGSAARAGAGRGDPPSRRSCCRSAPGGATGKCRAAQTCSGAPGA